MDWMRSRGAARRDAAGRMIHWYGSVESIDEHKRAADELRCSEARLRAICDSVPVGIEHTDVPVDPSKFKRYVGTYDFI